VRSPARPLPSSGWPLRGRLPEDDGPLTLAETINRTLVDVLAAHPNALVFGEDVGVKGGVYGVTRGLQKRFGAARVFDSLLDEQSILGLALGAAVAGFCCRSPRSSTSPTSTTPRTSCAARRPACRSSRTASTATHGGADRRLRLPEGLRRPLPQRQLGRGAARHPRPRDRQPSAPLRRRADAAHVRGGGQGRWHRQRVPRADRALPHPRPARAGRRRVDLSLPAARIVGRRSRRDRRGAPRARRRRRAPRDLGQRARPVVAGGQGARRGRRVVPRVRPPLALARCRSSS
jgi:hypothetical protein